MGLLGSHTHTHTQEEKSGWMGWIGKWAGVKATFKGFVQSECVSYYIPSLVTYATE